VTSILPLMMQNIEVRRAGRAILGPLDPMVETGGALVVLGPNGSGRSTLLRVCHGITRANAGSAAWSALRSEADLAQAFVFQTPILLRRTAIENVIYPLVLRGESKRPACNRALQMLEDVGLKDMPNLRASVLSGGAKQKLALARGLVTRPEVLFLDEPTASLDGRCTREIEAILTAAQAQGTKLVMATHDLGQARRIASHITFLLNGAIVETAFAEPFFAGPQTQGAQAFLKGGIVE
jgi:tungstate transport system ATP-binding protein